MAKKKSKTGTFSSVKSTATRPQPESAEQNTNQAAEKFVGQWNRLVSTTNWEKGRIICEWREALMTSGAAVTEYSDEAWSQLVGGVTSQHVGRLRRVYQRFWTDREQYDGLYWSHFQAALEWDDAEMWLEGAIHNEWSISQMRGKRWETLGTPPEEQKAELAAEQVVFETEAAAPSAAAVAMPSETAAPTAAKTLVTDEPAEIDDEPVAPREATPKSAVIAPEPGKRSRVKIDVDELPDDLAEAFESFKLAIIAHRREGWSETTPAEVVKCLDALRELALAE